MSLSDFEIEKITEIVAGKVGEKLDAKTLRQVVDKVVDGLKEKPANPEITRAIFQSVSAARNRIVTGARAKPR